MAAPYIHPSILAFVFVYKPKRNERRCRSLVSLRPAASLARFHSIKRSSSFASFPEVQCNTCTAGHGQIRCRSALASIQAASSLPPSGSNCDNTGGQTNLISQKSTSLALLRFSGPASPLSVAVLPLPLRISRLSLSVRDRRGRVDSHSSYAVIPPSLTDKTQTWTL